uniref:Putative secreted peptide n=1 Tax=Anopheles braziliensis TaxID=58242 RepID=A0A2M3ZVN4_9DIPT
MLGFMAFESYSCFLFSLLLSQGIFGLSATKYSCDTCTFRLDCLILGRFLIIQTYFLRWLGHCLPTLAGTDLFLIS